MGDPSLRVLGAHDDRFVLKKSCADRNYLLSGATAAGVAEALQRVIARERIDVVLPASDTHVRLLSRLRDDLRCRVFLPGASTIDLCQDKYALAALLRTANIPAPVTRAVSDLDAIDALFEVLAPHGGLLWCRLRRGTASVGATAVRTPAHARGWIRHWHDLRGVPIEDFTLSEYLPGRDFLCQGLWKDGRLVLVRTFERLSYFGGAANPSGLSSLSALAKTVIDPRVVDVCRAAVAAVDARASGVFSIDLKEDAAGVPCLTEINAGRFFMAMSNFDAISKHNMAVMYVRLARGEDVDLHEEYDVVPDHYMVRDLDTLPGVFHADALFENIEEA